MANNFVSKHPGAFALGQSIFELAQGCSAYETLSIVAKDPKVEIIIPDVPVGEGPQGKLIRTDGSYHTFDIRHYLNLVKNDAVTKEHIMRSWYLGALVTAGDLLEAKSYFDHQPEFELVYHLETESLTVTSSISRRQVKNAYSRIMLIFAGSTIRNGSKYFRP